MKTDFQNISWYDIEKLIKSLSSKVSATSKDFSSISTISHGGWFLQDCWLITWELIRYWWIRKKIPSDSLFVDDIYDSGSTFKKIIPKITDSNFVYATLFARQGKKYPKQLVYAQKTKQDEYIVFPWDRLEYMRLKFVK
jgi:hypoxanthine phosphoribosyltransferase